MPQNHNDSRHEGSESAVAQPVAPSAAIPQVTEGTCYVLFAHDVGLSIDLDDAERRVTTVKHRETISHKKRAPEHFTYDPAPLRVSQSAEPLNLGSFQISGNIDAMIYDFGAVSITYRIPLRGPMSDLLTLSDELYDNAELLADARRRIEELLDVIRPAINKPSISNLVEDYVIYQIEAMEPPTPRNAFVAENRLLIAQILRAERESLSEQQISDALACQLNYANCDMLVLDWNATLLLDTDADDIRAVLEYANVELLEMRNLDNSLDQALDESYSMLGRRKWTHQFLLSSQIRELRRVAELQVDGALMFEGVNNAIKLLGDQYLARVYRAASERLHLNDWDANIIRKLQTLESIYQKMSDHAAHWRMELLEWIIIILIAISIGVSFLPGIAGH